MARFTSGTKAEAVVLAPRQAIWDVLTDPALVAELTPLLQRIEADGEHWTWHMTGIDVLGVKVKPTFTERMSYRDLERIDFVHDPERTDEKAGVDGRYVLKGARQGTDLSIELSITVELPFPKVARPAVHTAMRAVVATMGARFSHNLVRHLSADDA